MKALLIVSVSLVACLSSSCNTFIGMGQDFRILGDSMVNAGHNSGKKNTGNQPEKQGGAPVY